MFFGFVVRFSSVDSQAWGEREMGRWGDLLTLLHYYRLTPERGGPK